MFKKSVDSVLKSFNKAIAELETVATQNVQASVDKAERSALLKMQANNHAAEAQKAMNVAGKLKELIA